MSDVGETVTVPACPVPFNTTVCEGTGDWGITVRIPVRAPAANGVNATGMLQLAPAAIEKQELNVGNEKSLPFVPVKVSEGLLKNSVESPVFEMVTNSVGLCVFTVCGTGNVSVDGESVITGPVAVPFNTSVNGPPAESV